MIAVEVLYFAALKDLVGLRSERLEFDLLRPSVSELCAELERVRPALQGRLRAVRVAIDESFAQPSDEVPDGATLALIPPVSGG